MIIPASCETREGSPHGNARTVEVHRAHLMHKLGFHNQAGRIRYAPTRGIVAMDPERPPADSLTST